MSLIVHRIDRVETGSAPLRGRLESHPAIKETGASSQLQGLTFWQGSWKREVRVGDPSPECAGLMELMDNNPLVCADYNVSGIPCVLVFRGGREVDRQVGAGPKQIYTQLLDRAL